MMSIYVYNLLDINDSTGGRRTRATPYTNIRLGVYEEEKNKQFLMVLLLGVYNTAVAAERNIIIIIRHL